MAERKSPAAAAAAAIVVRARGGSYLWSGEEMRGEIGEDACGGGVTGDHNGFVSIDVRDSAARASR